MFRGNHRRRVVAVLLQRVVIMMVVVCRMIGMMEINIHNFERMMVQMEMMEGGMFLNIMQQGKIKGRKFKVRKL